MKIGLFFGSFNPVHTGHLILAEAIADAAALDRVWLVVSPQNPFKTQLQMLGEYDRLRLCEMAIEGNPRLFASNVEFALSKPSFTVHTLAHLSERYPRYQFGIIMGQDNLASLHRWKNYRAIVDHYPIYVYPRPAAEAPAEHYTSVQLLDAPMLDISSSMIRERIRAGRSVRYLLPDAVREEIERRAFYLT